MSEAIPVATQPANSHNIDTIDLEQDEGLADITNALSTSSVQSSVYKTVSEYGRQYHAYKDGTYHRPNDELELERLDMMHALLQVVNDGKLYQAPIAPDESHRVLDIGTGTGIWAIELGDQMPAAEIVGVDISPSMPTLVPPNVEFEIFDVEDPWSFTRRFDYIHSRYMAGSIKDWPMLMQQSYENLQPGGWMECEDFDVFFYSQDQTLTDDHAVKRWLEGGYKVADITGRTFRPGKDLAGWMQQAGFEDVQVLRRPVPVGLWPKDKKLKQIGYLNYHQLNAGLSGFSLRLFCGVLGWSQSELEALLLEVRKDFRDKRIHMLMDLYTVWGRKPGGGG